MCGLVDWSLVPPSDARIYIYRADGGPKTGPTKYDYLRRLARFFNRMQGEPSLGPYLYANADAGEGEVKVRVVLWDCCMWVARGLIGPALIYAPC